MTDAAKRLNRTKVKGVVNALDDALPEAELLALVRAQYGYAQRWQQLFDEARRGWSLYFPGSIPASARKQLKALGFHYAGTHWSRPDD